MVVITANVSFETSVLINLFRSISSANLVDLFVVDVNIVNKQYFKSLVLCFFFQKYEVEFLLQQQWFDPRLRYSNQSQYEFLNAIHHHEDIWLPDTYFIMHGDFKDPIIPMHFALRIYRNGTINYLMRRHLILSCQGRLNIFPFDDPLCSFALESSKIIKSSHNTNDAILR